MNIPRSSGILMHVTSLPCKYGIGDLGANAYRFVDFLENAGQRYWQVLPLNPTRLSGGNSPYGSPSAFAGNALLISPRKLYEQGLIRRKVLKSGKGFRDDRVVFSAVTTYKTHVLNSAYKRFQTAGKKSRFAEMATSFETFKEDNSEWLDDYALFTVLSEHFNRSWTEWPHPLRDRAPEALEEARTIYRESIERIKFSQFLFFSQWSELVEYARSKGIGIFGDLPFYVAGDSTDTWTNAQYFKYGPGKKPMVVSGVPPDAFSAGGQLWGTPVFDWDALEKEDFDWWIRRLKQNLKMFDLLRLDHFRAFSAYWEVPADDGDAINGKWVDTPGEAFFSTVAEAFPDMPFVAEDLGEIDQPVYDLRDQFGLPGMNVLQYAFGDDTGRNQFLPHNHRNNSVTYVGTHDNPTVVEWFSTLSNHEKRNLEAYVGMRLRKRSVPEAMQRLALGSVSNLAVLQMQDLLGLGSQATMNRPGTTRSNWEWRMRSMGNLKSIAKDLRVMVRMYGR